ncbi:MAG: prohibitin family protein [Chloroflexi bacterium]|nr:MAG: prohibitin family protein [Chloroflexota bacterium]TMB79323.1 MAG: prohibitin family protein [Chloroflexota bacterium]TMC30437.1 MAG: prohibitin family protein [Chloroflexota bacterium]TMC32341.1 MAG: prohibitin family protein [Chloroflexota bacterium]TMC59186.1 MAG: prohibitin family protein [Chloroflexota bacterium]
MSLRGTPARGAGPALGIGAVGVVFALFLVFVAFGSFTQVGVGEVGIVKHFGAIDPSHPDVFDPGIHTKVPFRDDVVIFETRIQKEQVDASAASKDGVTIHSTIAVNFHIDASKAPLILQNIGPNYKDRIIDQQIQQAFKDVTGQYAGLELIQKREEVASRAKDTLRDKLSPYYIIVDEFTIPNYEFPKEFNDAILATQVANQQNLQAKQLQEKARTEADTALIVAQGLANAQKAQATTLTPEYLQLQAIAKWNGQLPQYLTPNTALPFIGTVPQTTR